MTLFEMFNLDLKELNKVLNEDKEVAQAFEAICDRVGFCLEIGRAAWIELDHDMNCPHCKEKVTIH